MTGNERQVRWLESVNPADGGIVGRVAITPVDEIPSIVARARAVQPAWAALGAAARAKMLLEAAPMTLHSGLERWSSGETRKGRWGLRGVWRLVSRSKR